MSNETSRVETGEHARLVVVHPDAPTLAAAVASRLVTRLLDLQSVRRPVHVVLTGGTVGIASLSALRDHPVRDAVDWSGVHLWWGDERFLTAGHADRNETQARAALLDHLPTLPTENVHPMPDADRAATPEASARAYADELAAHAADGELVPRFDVLLLGMGPDGHVASLFPGHPGLDVAETATAGVHGSPKPPPERVTLTFDALGAARQAWVVAAGTEKSAAVASALAGVDLHETPAAAVRGTERTLWLIDAAASSVSDR